MPPASLHWTRLLPQGFIRLILLLACATAAPANERTSPRMLLLDGAKAGPNRVVVVGERGAIFLSSDNGETWNAVPSGTSETLTGVAFSDDNHGWAVGHGGIVLATRDGGLSWRRELKDESVQTSFLDVVTLDEHTVVIVGAFGAIRATPDSGISWTTPDVPDNEPHLNRILVDPKGALWAVGEAGTVLTSKDRGVTWSSLASPEPAVSLYGAQFVGSGVLLVHGLRGHLYRITLADNTWERVPNEHPVMLSASCRLATGDILFAGAARWFLISSDEGKTVRRIRLPATTAVAELIRLPYRRVLALGEAGLTLVDLDERSAP